MLCHLAGGEWASRGTGATSVTLTGENRPRTLARMNGESVQDLSRAGWPSWQRRYWVSEHNLELLLANIIHRCRDIPLYTVDPNPTSPKIVEASATTLARQIAPALIAHLERHQDRMPKGFNDSLPGVLQAMIDRGNTLTRKEAIDTLRMALEELIKLRTAVGHLQAGISVSRSSSTENSP
jgi:hypothetical protein